MYIAEQNMQFMMHLSCNMNAFFSCDLFMVYIPECKQQLKTMK